MRTRASARAPRWPGREPMRGDAPSVIVQLERHATPDENNLGVERCWVVSAGVKNPEGLAIGDGGVRILADDLSAVADTGCLDVHLLSRLDRD